MRFGLMFFAAEHPEPSFYDFVLQTAEWADDAGLAAVWTPERHFHEFGGAFPNPAILSAAVAVRTSRIAIRAGSLISPLHQTVRIAEDWSLVDNLSKGRVGVSFGSGWNIQDFVLATDGYDDRKQIMVEQIRATRSLWAGDALSLPNGRGQLADVRIYPRPVQGELPIWITSSGSSGTFALAGELGANILTHLVGQDFNGLRENVLIYREMHARERGKRRAGTVTVMLHTFLAPRQDAVERIVKAPLVDYLCTAVSLEQAAGEGGGTLSGGKRSPARRLGDALVRDIATRRAAEYLERGALLGDFEKCADIVRELTRSGVDEIACLVDFGIPRDVVIEHLPYIQQLEERVTRARSVRSTRA